MIWYRPPVPEIRSVSEALLVAWMQASDGFYPVSGWEPQNDPNVPLSSALTLLLALACSGGRHPMRCSQLPLGVPRCLATIVQRCSIGSWDHRFGSSWISSLGHVCGRENSAEESENHFAQVGRKVGNLQPFPRSMLLPSLDGFGRILARKLVTDPG